MLSAMSDADEHDPTRELLDRWHGGDEAALEELLALHGSWIHHRVRRRLGAALRKKVESVDIVQDALVELLKYGPRFTVEGQGQFRALMGQIVENRIRDARDWFSAQRRTMSREQRLSESILDLSGVGITRPDKKAEKLEWEQLVKLAVTLLDAEDREVIMKRQWDELQFDEIGEQLDISPDAARMRFNRALPKLALKIEALQAGRIEAPDEDAVADD